MSSVSYRLVLFDLDGVLVDSREAMRIAWETVRRELDVDVPFVAYFREIGRPFPQIIARLGLSSELADIERIYKSVTLAEVSRAVAYPHVDETLLGLVAGGTRVGVVTSKSRRLSIETLRQFRTPFATLRTPEDGPGKPRPHLLHSAIDAVGVAPHETVYVGDMAVDQQAAAAAGVDFLHAAWGYGSCPPGTPTLHYVREAAALGGGAPRRNPLPAGRPRSRPRPPAAQPLTVGELRPGSLPYSGPAPEPSESVSPPMAPRLPISSPIERSPSASSRLTRSAGSRLIPSERRRAACSSSARSRL
jgi:phosphoglycolate phosphatase